MKFYYSFFVVSLFIVATVSSVHAAGSKETAQQFLSSPHSEEVAAGCSSPFDPRHCR